MQSAVSNSYTSKDIALTVSAQGVLQNDSDADKEDSLNAVIVSNPANGTLTFNSDGSFTYTPNNGFSGTDSFTYKANDGYEDSATATVTITVIPPGYGSSPAPGSTINVGTVIVGSPVSTALSISETGNATLNVSSLAISGTNASDFTITPSSGFTIADGGASKNVTIQCTPSEAGARTASLTIAHNATGSPATYTLNCTGTLINVAPIASNNSLTTTSGVSVSGKLNATDANGDALTYIIVTQPTKGTLSPNPSYPNFKYLPNVGVTGTDTFTFKANDGKADSNIATVTITVNAVGGGTFTRTLPECYTAGVRLTVTLNAEPSSGTMNYLVEDVVPVGWTVSNISNSGLYDDFNRKIKWRFQDGVKRTLSYDVMPPASDMGDKSFTGTAYPDTAVINISEQAVITQCSPYHPADTNKDFVLSGNEVSTYGYYWKKGLAWSVEPNPIPMNYVVSAAGLWFEGEKYKLDVTAGACPLCWISDLTRQVSASGRAVFGNDCNKTDACGL